MGKWKDKAVFFEVYKRLEEMMTCSYFEYRDIVSKYFYGVPLTNEHLNRCTENLRQYFIKGGAIRVLKSLGIGLRIRERCKENSTETTLIDERFIFMNGEREGDELRIHEIENIGLFLKYGPYEYLISE